jgi:hypothetical protein
MNYYGQSHKYSIMKTTIAIIFSLLSLATATAQRICATPEYKTQSIQANPALQATFNSIEQQIANVSGRVARDTTSNELISIPVVIHVIYNTADQNISDAQILTQIAALNNDFAYQNADKVNTPAAFKNLAADIRIKFCLAQVDAKGNRTTGIIRINTKVSSFSADDAMKFSLQGGDNAWDSKKYLNIWVCNLSGRSLGYATTPGSEFDKDGVVIAFDAFGTKGTLRPTFNKGRTATHEIGHWLGLKHLWGDAVCGDDMVDDTPNQKSYNYGAPSFPKMSPCSPNANGDMFMNYMDFSDDATMNMFTIGQKRRMRANFAKDGFRNSFLTSFACDSNLVQAAALPVVAPVKPTVTATVASFKVYPNPVQSVINIEAAAGTFTTAKTIRIFNTTGINVMTTQLAKTTASFTLSTLPAGFYIIKIGEGATEFTSKFVKM